MEEIQGENEGGAGGARFLRQDLCFFVRDGPDRLGELEGEGEEGGEGESAGKSSGEESEERVRLLSESATLATVECVFFFLMGIG